MHPDILMVRNEGADIVDTNYWSHAFNERGEFFLSTNAGAIRLLMPTSQRAALAEMRTGNMVVLTRGRYHPNRPDDPEQGDGVELLFDDGSETPFALFIGAHQIDRLWPGEWDTREVPFVVYDTDDRKPFKAWESRCGLRSVKGSLPCLKPWGVPAR